MHKRRQLAAWNYHIWIGLIWLLGSASVATCEQPTAIHRWAIIPLDDQAKALTDLLTAELSDWPNVSLLERVEIERVLEELRLNSSGLVRSDFSAQFGRLANADALLLIGQPDAAASSPNDKRNAQGELRVRLVETRTSLRLLDMALSTVSVEAIAAGIRTELRIARDKVLLPANQRQIIGVMPIKSEETGDFLASYCERLTTLIEVQLHRQPQFVVVERRQLQALMAENVLTGVELDLRAATRLLEVGVRRSATGDGIIASCRLLTPGQRLSAPVTLDVASLNPTELRNAIVNFVARDRGIESSRITSLSSEAEAAEFDRRSEWLGKANQL
ncbi:MAG: hypothetical protein KDA47_03865, partial [Planctomycetales bacterium]|nr:hypothetical protein [Planctomycetales bacterium]